MWNLCPTQLKGKITLKVNALHLKNDFGLKRHYALLTVIMPSLYLLKINLKRVILNKIQQNKKMLFHKTVNFTKGKK